MPNPNPDFIEQWHVHLWLGFACKAILRFLEGYPKGRTIYFKEGRTNLRNYGNMYIYVYIYIYIYIYNTKLIKY